MEVIRRKKRPFRDVLSKQLFDARQLCDLTGPMSYEALLAFWFFLGRHAAPSVTIIIPPGVRYSRTDVS